MSPTEFDADGLTPELRKRGYTVKHVQQLAVMTAQRAEIGRQAEAAQVTPVVGVPQKPGKEDDFGIYGTKNATVETDQLSLYGDGK